VQLATAGSGAGTGRRDQKWRLSMVVSTQTMSSSSMLIWWSAGHIAVGSEERTLSLLNLLSAASNRQCVRATGRQVFVTAGLVRRLSSEANWRRCLSRGVGHVVGRHAAEHLAKQQPAALTPSWGSGSDSEDGGGRRQ